MLHVDVISRSYANSDITRNLINISIDFDLNYRYSYSTFEADENLSIEFISKSDHQRITLKLFEQVYKHSYYEIINTNSVQLIFKKLKNLQWPSLSTKVSNNCEVIKELDKAKESSIDNPFNSTEIKAKVYSDSKFIRLPIELLYEIFQHLHLFQLTKLRLVCGELNTIILPILLKNFNIPIFSIKNNKNYHHIINILKSQVSIQRVQKLNWNCEFKLQKFLEISDDEYDKEIRIFNDFNDTISRSISNLENLECLRFTNYNDEQNFLKFLNILRFNSNLKDLSIELTYSAFQKYVENFRNTIKNLKGLKYFTLVLLNFNDANYENEENYLKNLVNDYISDYILIKTFPNYGLNFNQGHINVLKWYNYKYDALINRDEIMRISKSTYYYNDFIGNVKF